ncbi:MULTISPECIES: methyltransferase domain-containing protein [Streptomyces]|uniref:methyltransferase domain-containing protein n=1 Tax=Streptomyces sp. H-KF8 TaxID=1727216 RepID=UPI0007ECEA57|nr:methyltransferase domain-containing protein [Streptomyces sp. H-KF8]OBQ47683.1 methyltransferase [Streptomyces sp. H-KF8]
MTRSDGYLLEQRRTDVHRQNGTHRQAEEHLQAEAPLQAEAAERLDAFADLFDPTTFRHLEAVGVGAGWRCWEIGAGGASVVSWLAKKVGPTGTVLATATDVTRLAPAARPPVEVRAHDIGAEEPPTGGFDLVHARLPLLGVADRERAVRSMAGALRPRGHLLVEDTDPALQPLACPDEYGPEQRLANRLRQGLRKLLHDQGEDLAQGRTLPRLLRETGLSEVRADAHFPIAAPACAALESATVRLARDRLVTAGVATTQDIDHHLAHIADGILDLATAPMISAWGRKA